MANRDFIGLVNGENNRLDFLQYSRVKAASKKRPHSTKIATHIILAHYPKNERREVFRVDELSKRLAAAKQLQRRTVALRNVRLMNERRYDMRALQIIIVVRAENVARNNRRVSTIQADGITSSQPTA